MDQVIRASAPGSVMITGEHAVVYGHRAIVAGIEQRAHVTIVPRADRMFRITSQIGAPQQGSLDDLPAGGTYRFVLAAIARHAPDLPCGFDMDITSGIDPRLGLGSSAAVTVACLGALSRLAGRGTEGLHDDALRIVRAIQGRGSGADLAASLHGGFVAYRAPDGGAAQIEALPVPPGPFGLRYAGYKTPTAEVLRLVADRMAGNEAAFDALYSRMGASADAAIRAAQGLDWAAFHDALNEYQRLMEQLGVSDDTLDAIIREARDAGAAVAKISGSGLGDCVLALGDQPKGFVPASIAEKGLVFDD
ncbi:mevalonate kinase family protein [Paracoccus zeaxanthinifaciens]|uniref:Phosphomevalonate kinase n=1 Tax=Paracoccus zeaxanthinifaciens TaxID=187400 RepID=Q8L1I1_PARZE|nr:mevalonate kinase [Paracoccus zeaxanthinifaciens]CAD24422.1 phosphomevalonate kinase [Paracoccus zeaxanthinifaciens]